MHSAARLSGAVAALFAVGAFAQDFGLDLTNDVDTGAPKLTVKLWKELSGATLYVDDVEIGALPMDAVPITKGKHTVTVTRPGYADFTSSITAKAGTTTVEVTMDATGEALHLTSEPDAADIVVDGKGQGKTPKFLSLAPGKHDLRLVKDGYMDWTYTIFTRAGRDSELNGELKQMAQAGDKPLATNLEPEQVDPDLLRARARSSSPEWYQRWYVWAGAAVVVAAVVTGVAVASSHHSGPPLDPNTVCGGPCDIVINSPP